MNLTEKLYPPCKCRLLKEEKKTLIGKAYYFSELSGNKITSPFAGIVKRVFSNYSVQITGLGGVQILLAIELTEKKTQTLDEIFRCQVRSEQRVALHTTLFTIYQPTKIK
jgi:phosphotransferase system IIA component